MPANKKIIKYYIGFGILGLIVLFLLIFVIAQASNAKVDNETDKALDKISDKLDSYINKNNKLPVTLSEIDAGTIPSSIKYNKLDASRYKICMYYKSPSNGYGADWSSLIWGSALSGTYDDVDTSTNGEKSYFDSYTLKYKHKKGENCQTVKPYISDYSSYPSPSPSSTSTYCSSTYDGYYAIKAEAEISKVEAMTTTSGTLYFSTSTQTVKNNKNGTAVANTISSKKYDNLTYICKNGTRTTATDLKTNQKVTFYLYSSTEDGYIYKINL